MNRTGLDREVSFFFDAEGSTSDPIVPNGKNRIGCGERGCQRDIGVWLVTLWGMWLYLNVASMIA